MVEKMLGHVRADPSHPPHSDEKGCAAPVDCSRSAHTGDRPPVPTRVLNDCGSRWMAVNYFPSQFVLAATVDITGGASGQIGVRHGEVQGIRSHDQAWSSAGFRCAPRQRLIRRTTPTNGMGFTELHDRASGVSWACSGMTTWAPPVTERGIAGTVAPLNGRTLACGPRPAVAQARAGVEP
jgi:hypothetical protein